MKAHLACLLIPVLAVSHCGAQSQDSKPEEPGGSLHTVKRDVLISNPGKYRIPDEQLHFPYLYESTRDI